MVQRSIGAHTGILHDVPGVLIVARQPPSKIECRVEVRRYARLKFSLSLLHAANPRESMRSAHHDQRAAHAFVAVPAKNVANEVKSTRLFRPQRQPRDLARNDIDSTLQLGN